jgi:serine/threonine protein kinase
MNKPAPELDPLIYTEKVVAVKVLLRHLASDPPSIKRFQREAKSASMLSHPNLLEVFDFGVTVEGQAFIVMEFVQGKSLEDVVHEEGKIFAIPDFLDVCAQICSGLQHAHENGVIHRDLKPSNVMMREVDGKRLVQIVDFGLAKVMDEAAAAKITQSSQVVGSPVYLSPEQYTDFKLGPHVDIYALGCMMYELLTGAPPFTGQSINEIVQKHLNEAPKPLPDEIPLPVRDCIMRTLSKDPTARPSVEEIQTMLQEHQIALA